MTMMLHMILGIRKMLYNLELALKIFLKSLWVGRFRWQLYTKIQICGVKKSPYLPDYSIIQTILVYLATLSVSRTI